VTIRYAGVATIFLISYPLQPLQHRNVNNIRQNAPHPARQNPATTQTPASDFMVASKLLRKITRVLYFYSSCINFVDSASSTILYHSESNRAKLRLRCVRQVAAPFSAKVWKLWSLLFHYRHCRFFFTTEQFLRARARNASRVLAIVWAFVRPSVTLRYCIKQTQTRIKKLSLWVDARTLVYRDKILCAWVRRFPSNASVKEGYPPKICSFYRYWLV